MKRRFHAAKRVAVLTGAGISAESGVPTFRGGGDATIWEWRGRPVSDLSSAELLSADPKLVWEWFDYRRGLVDHLRRRLDNDGGRRVVVRIGPIVRAVAVIGGGPSI